MEPQRSLLCSEESSTGSYPEPNASSPHLRTLFPKIHSNNILPFKPVSYNWPLPFGFPTSIFIHLSSLPYVLHAPHISLCLIWSP